MARFREVISSIPLEIRLEQFLNDGDSPDISTQDYARCPSAPGRWFHSVS
jgi:hypothetical protein